MRTVLYCKHSKGSRPLFVKIKCNIAGLLSTGTPPHLLAAQDPARLLPRTVNGTGLMALGTQMLGGLPAKISCWSVHRSLRYDFSSVFLITGPRAVPCVFFYLFNWIARGTGNIYGLHTLFFFIFPCIVVAIKAPVYWLMCVSVFFVSNYAAFPAPESVEKNVIVKCVRLHNFRWNFVCFSPLVFSLCDYYHLCIYVHCLLE